MQLLVFPRVFFSLSSPGCLPFTFFVQLLLLFVTLIAPSLFLFCCRTLPHNFIQILLHTPFMSSSPCWILTQSWILINSESISAILFCSSLVCLGTSMVYQSGSIQETETISVILIERFNILINQILENWKGKSGILRCHTRSSCRKKTTEERSWN